MTSGRDRSESDNDVADGAQMREALGGHLRTLRRRSGKSLREAAARAGMSPTFVSLVERGQTEIALSRLVRLADVYDANVADLLAEIQGPDVEFVPAAAALVAPRSSGEPKLVYLTSPSWRLQPFRIEIEPGEALESLAHAGEEFVHCVSGVVEMTVDGVTWALHAGDTIVVPPHAPHSYRNHGDALGVVVGAVAPPRRWRPEDRA
jgi:quercetin dioxygenase-like cupin family protein